MYGPGYIIYITFAVYARFKSVNLKKYYKQKIIILVGAPTGGGPGPCPLDTYIWLWLRHHQTCCLSARYDLPPHKRLHGLE